MSGHSKWSKVKHQKATTDVVKAAAFTRAARAITVAVREGGGVTDPDHNFRLRLAIEKAHDVNMPKDNIERAIAKAGGGEAGDLKEAQYEGYGPGNVAFIIETLSDNTNRTVSEVKNILEHHGGTLVAKGAVSHMFTRKGLLLIAKSGLSYEKVFEGAVAAGAEDVVEMDDVFEVYTAYADLAAVKTHFDGQGIPTGTPEIIMKPAVTMPVPPEISAKNDSLAEELEGLDDVQRVFTNAA